MVPRARRSVGAHCEVVLTGLILAVCLIVAAILFVRMFGLLGVAAWFVVDGAWWYAGTRHRLDEWEMVDARPVLVFVGGFAAQAMLNAHWNHAGDAVFVAWHAIAITAAIRQSSFPRARARRRRCANG